MTLRVDTELLLPEAPGAPDRIGTAEGALALHGQAGPRDFLVEGGRVSLSGPERGAVASMTVSGRVRAADIGADVGTAVNVVASPGLLRREHLGPRGSVVETLLAAPALPLAALQWAGVGSSARAPASELRFTLVPGAASTRYHAGPGVVMAIDEARPEEIVVALVHPVPSRWRVEEAPNGGAVVRGVVETGGPLTLLVAAGPEDRVRPALAAGAHLGAHERAAQAPAGDLGLAIASGVPEIDDAVAWARARLRGSLCHPASDVEHPARSFWSALGALAAGDASTALAFLSVLEASGSPLGESSFDRQARGALTLPSGPLAPFVAARIALTFGDATPARSHVHALTPATLDTLRAESDERTWALWALTLELLADALRFGGSDAEVQRLREAAALPPGRATRQVRLPVLGAGAKSGGDGPDRLLRLLLRREPEPVFAPLAEESSDPAGLIEAWSALAAGDVERGWSRWRAALGSGLSGRPGPRGSWDGAEGPRLIGAPGAASVLGGLVHGVLGLAPDAPAGRVSLSPAFPSHARSFDATNLAVGDCRFGLSYRKDKGSVRFVVEPTRGRVPPLLVLAPTLSANRIDAVRVDGAAADLDVVSRGAGLRVQAQLPLDGARSLEIETS